MEGESKEQNKDIIPKIIDEEMKTAYLNYAMSVIIGRALPDVRDGLKPVHRRILYTMYNQGMFHNRPFKKCAKIVGQCLSDWHPHGDSSVYDALVRMAQDFSLRNPLVKSQGNFGSIDGDNAAAYRYCLTADTLIQTENGLLPIESISNKSEKKIKLEILNYQGKRKTAVKFFNSGKHDIYKLTTSQDYSIKGSSNHPILCWSKNEFGMPIINWKLLSEITTKDYVLINRGHFLFAKKNLSLKPYFPKVKPREKNIKLPKTMNKSLAFLLGALVSEGSFHQNKILFNNQDIEFYNTVKNSLLTNFDGSSVYERDMKENCTELDFYHQKPVRFLINLGLKKVQSDKKEVPHIIFKSKKEIVRSFLIGLYEGDGSVVLQTDKQHGGKVMLVSYDSKSITLLNQLKILLLNFGISSGKLHKDNRSNCYKLIIDGVDNVQRFAKEIGFFSKRKNSILSKINTMNKFRMSKNDVIPYLSDYLRANYSNQFIKRNNFDRYCNLEKNYDKLITLLKPTDQKLLSWILNNRFLFEKVKEITKLKEKENVYSIKVDSSDHSFIGNGFVNHNTEAKLNKLAEEILRDIDKETVDFKPNFDASLQEPVVLPAKVPNLLINGSNGIAVGMATSIPPHNLSEVCDAVVKTIENPEITTPELMKIIPGPDFPTGGEVVCGEALHHAYETGKGKVQIKAVAEFEDNKIIIKEIPYQVNKADLIIQIADLVKEKRVEGIKNINDESDREGIRVVIDLKKDADPQIILNQLYKYSRLKVTFGIQILALVDNQPKLLGLKEVISLFINHRKDVVIRRTNYELKIAQKRAHILQGLLVALENIDPVIKGIKESKTVEDARHFLITNYTLSEEQAKAILDMKLQKLSSLEREKIRSEFNDLQEKICGYQELLASKEKILNVVSNEVSGVKESYGDKRRSKIVIGEDEDYDLEELIEESTQVVTMTNEGYLKRLPIDTYRTQKRGGRGVKAAGTKEEDFVSDLYVTSTHNFLLCISNQGQLYWLKVYKIPEGSRQSRGKHIANLLELNKEEHITAVIPVKDFNEGNLFMATKLGIVKKTPLEQFSKPRRGGIRALSIDKGDELIGVKHTDGNQNIILVTNKGLANRFNEKDVRPMGRTARGVMGIRLNDSDYVVSLIATQPGKELLTLTEKGYGKRTPFDDYRLCRRGGKGVINLKVTDKNGPVVKGMLVEGNEELMLISQHGIGIRVSVSDISVIGRATQGVRVMRLGEGDKLAAAAKIIPEDEEDGEDNGDKE